jgi:uncharacterized protein VirK/YbjX
MCREWNHLVHWFEKILFSLCQSYSNDKNRICCVHSCHAVLTDILYNYLSHRFDNMSRTIKLSSHITMIGYFRGDKPLEKMIPVKNYPSLVKNQKSLFSLSLSESSSSFKEKKRRDINNNSHCIKEDLYFSWCYYYHWEEFFVGTWQLCRLH